jgi:hypothetical protein
MTKTLLGALCFALALPLAAADEKQILIKHWKTSGEFSVAVAEAMPEESYNFAPNPEEMGFGMLMIHFANGNVNIFKSVTGMEGPAMPEKLAAAFKSKGPFEKAAVVQFLRDSFAYCDKALAALEPALLDKMIGPEGPRQASGRERLWAAFTHTAHHRGQAEVYLRVKNIKPPQYRF